MPQSAVSCKVTASDAPTQTICPLYPSARGLPWQDGPVPDLLPYQLRLRQPGDLPDHAGRGAPTFRGKQESGQAQPLLLRRAGRQAWHGSSGGRLSRWPAQSCCPREPCRVPQQQAQPSRHPAVPVQPMWKPSSPPSILCCCFQATPDEQLSDGPASRACSSSKQDLGSGPCVSRAVLLVGI